MNKLLGNSEGQQLFFNTVIDIIYHLGSDDFAELGIESAVDFKNLFNRADVLLSLENAIDHAEEFKSELEEPWQVKTFETAIKNAIDYKDTILEADTKEKLNELKEALEQVIENSFPKKKKEIEQTGGAIFKMLKAREKKQTETKPAWEQIYTDFYLSGGCTIEQFYKLTIRQIEAVYPEIDFNRAKEFEMQAGLHGIKLKGKVRRKEQSEFSETEIAAFEKEHQKMMESNRIN